MYYIILLSPLSQCLFNSIEHGVRLRSSSSPVEVTANAFADALAVTPFPSQKRKEVLQLLLQETGSDLLNNRAILNQAFWNDKSPSKSCAITLFRFVGEFKCTLSAKNFNQLLIDFASGQCQLRALGIRHTIWGATCSLGIVEVYSSEWDKNNSVRNMSSLVPLPLVYLQVNGSSLFMSILTENGT
jgi:hypothetical protein